MSISLNWWPPKDITVEDAMEMIENLWCQLTEEDKEQLRRGYEESIEFLEELGTRTA